MCWLAKWLIEGGEWIRADRGSVMCSDLRGGCRLREHISVWGW